MELVRPNNNLHDSDVASSIDGPTQWWGSQLNSIRQDFLGFLITQAKAHPGMCQIRPTPFQRFVLVSDPDLVTEVLVTRAKEFGKSHLTQKMVGRFLGEGMVLSEGEEHRRQRSLVQECFSPASLKKADTILETELSKRVPLWAGKDSIDLKVEMTQLTFKVILRLIFGFDHQSELGGELLSSFQGFAASMSQRFKSVPLPEWLPIKRHRDEALAVFNVTAEISKLLNQIDDAFPQTEHPPQPSLFGILQSAWKAGQISQQQAIDQIVTFLFAGHETVANLLTWSIALLAKHQDVQSELRDAPPGDDRLDACIKEVMRLFPPVWLFDRSPIQPTILAGKRINPRDVVYISPYVMHRNEAQFPQANSFLPWRFAGQPRLALPPYYLPFGLGGRSCIGQSLAMHESRTVIRYLLQNFCLDLVEADDLPPPTPSATLQPSRPIRVQVRLQS